VADDIGLIEFAHPQTGHRHSSFPELKYPIIDATLLALPAAAD
jgi:hypothetical protein